MDVVEDFYGVYLLHCLNEKYYGRIYIGYTVDPNRRITQHNKGSWAGGARRTSNKGPWKMVMIVHGFPNNISALRFEWAWQNPEQSRRFNHLINRKKLKNEKQLEYRLRILSEMLRMGPWNRLPLTVRWLADEFVQEFPPDKLPPIHMPICHGPVKSKKIKCSNDETGSKREMECDFKNKIPPCSLCHKMIEKNQFHLTCLNERCNLVAHINCLAELFLDSAEYIPIEGDCPLCCTNLLWGDLIRKMKGCRDVDFEVDNILNDDLLLP